MTGISLFIICVRKIATVHISYQHVISESRQTYISVYKRWTELLRVCVMIFSGKYKTTHTS